MCERVHCIRWNDGTTVEKNMPLLRPAPHVPFRGRKTSEVIRLAIAFMEKKPSVVKKKVDRGFSTYISHHSLLM